MQTKKEGEKYSCEKDFCCSGSHKTHTHCLVWGLQNPWCWQNLYIAFTLHLFVFWCWPSPPSHLQEWRIHLLVWGRQPAFLTPTVHSPGCPTSPALGCGWLPDGAGCGTSGLLVLHVFGKYSSPSLPSPCISLKGVSCCSSAFRFGTRSFNAVDWRLSVVSQEFWESDCTQSFPWGFWHCEWQGRQCSLSFCLSSLVGGKSHPAIPGFGLFSTLQFIFPFHLPRKCLSHFRRSRSHPLQAVLKANSLLPFSLFLLLCPGVLSKNKELQMEHSSL